ncbi:MAG: substrate-binding domain-containing protein [Gaiellales bacterium]
MRLSPKTLIAGLVAAAVLAVVPAAGATTYATGGSTGMQILASALAQAYTKNPANKDHARFTVAGGGSGAGINGVNAGTFVIGDSSRAPNQPCGAKGKDACGLVFYPISVEPFVVIVNPKNKVSSLTQAQINGIFQGQVTNWNQVGGANCPIKGYTRIAGSGTLSTFQTLYLGGAPVASSFSAQGSNGLVRAAVAGNSCAIGFVTYAYTVSNTTIKPLAVGGVAPSLANVKSGKFPYAGYQYFVTKGPATGAVLNYINWARSSGATSIISKYALPTTAAPVNS